MLDIKLFKNLIEIVSPTGREEKVSAIIADACRSYADEIYNDVMGNLIVRKKGDGPKILIAAHMDEIGIMVTFIDDKGFLRFTPVGGLRMHAALLNHFKFENGVCGVMSGEGKADWAYLPWNKCYIDIAARSKEEAEKLVKTGDTAAWVGDLADLNTQFAGKAMDDRAGCYVLIEALRSLKDVQCPNDIYFVFTVQEEVGLRGAMTAGYSIAPDFALAVDVTGVGDTPESYANACKLGGGPTVKLLDGGIVCHRIINNWLSETAKTNNIPFQYEILEGGATDVGTIHTTRSGVVSGGMSVPCRYIHSSIETVDKSDVENCVKLLSACLSTGLK